MGGVQAQLAASILSPFALTNVFNVRVQLGIPPTKLNLDLIRKIERLINACSAAIEEQTERLFVPRSTAEIYDGRGTDRFVPRHWPINSIAEVWLDSTSKFTDTNNLLDASEYAIADDQTTIELLGRRYPSSRYSVKFVYNHGKLPADISYACDLYCEWLFRLNEREDLGRLTRSKGDESVNIEQSVPQVVMDFILKHKRLEFGGATPRSSINI